MKTTPILNQESQKPLWYWMPLPRTNVILPSVRASSLYNNRNMPEERTNSAGLMCFLSVCVRVCMCALQVLQIRVESLSRLSLCQAEQQFKEAISGRVNYDKARSSMVFSLFNQV